MKKVFIFFLLFALGCSNPKDMNCVMNMELMTQSIQTDKFYCDKCYLSNYEAILIKSTDSIYDTFKDTIYLHALSNDARCRVLWSLEQHSNRADFIDFFTKSAQFSLIKDFENLDNLNSFIKKSMRLQKVFTTREEKKQLKLFLMKFNLLWHNLLVTNIDSNWNRTVDIYNLPVDYFKSIIHIDKTYKEAYQELQLILNTIRAKPEDNSLYFLIGLGTIRNLRNQFPLVVKIEQHLDSNGYLILSKKILNLKSCLFCISF